MNSARSSDNSESIVSTSESLGPKNGQVTFPYSWPQRNCFCGRNGALRTFLKFLKKVAEKFDGKAAGRPIPNYPLESGIFFMNSSIPSPRKAVLAQKECHDFVGGRPIWEELKRAHPEILIPFRRTTQGWEYYLVEVVLVALKAAQMSGSLIHKPSK